MINLQTPIVALSPIGRQLSKQLHKLGLQTVRDLVLYYPTRYEDLSQISPIRLVQPGITVTLAVKIRAIESRRSPRQRMMLTEAIVEDASGELRVVWFNQPFLVKILRPGDQVYLSGKIEDTLYGLQMQSPNYEKADRATIHTGRIVPIYPVTASLTNRQLRFLVARALPVVRRVPDPLPKQIRDAHKLLDLPRALEAIHFPKTLPLAAAARRRIAFDELFVVHMLTLQERARLDQTPAHAITSDMQKVKKFVSSLPFTLTSAQKKAAWQILKDMALPHPMNRLLDGDVGSGKTIVAAIAIFATSQNGKQSALMAPTEILARQHAETLLALFSRSAGACPPPAIAVLSRSMKLWSNREPYVSLTKKELEGKISSGEAGLIIGTHALIQESVIFHNLAFAIVDEQHRFGVEARQTLRAKSGTDLLPHLLSMTATPIPRTLTLSLYGDLDISILNEMPPGRKGTNTVLITPPHRKQMEDLVRAELQDGHQAIVICPLIDASDKLGVKSVGAEAERLARAFPHTSIAVLHGRMTGDAKESVMTNFANGKTKILVSTTVVEVGIDVPNATVIMIEGAERFGLATLHQLRGRIGRGTAPGTCFLLPGETSPETLKRLEYVVASNNGFKLAELDLELRGPGEVLGVRQSGLPEFKIASLGDLHLLEETKKTADDLLARDPTLRAHPLLAALLTARAAKIHPE